MRLLTCLVVTRVISLAELTFAKITVTSAELTLAKITITSVELIMLIRSRQRAGIVMDLIRIHRFVELLTMDRFVAQFAGQALFEVPVGFKGLQEVARL